MKIYHNIEDVPFDKNTVVTVGTFDGVHLGHQQIINSLVAVAKDKKLRSFIITLDPHPRIVLQNNGDTKSKIRLLNDIDDRIELFKHLGVENVLIINFTKEFAKTPPIEFIKNLIYQKIGFTQFIIGYDHSFGKDREGDINLLNQIKDGLRFDVTQIQPFLLDGQPVSSTKIRTAINEYDLSKANKMLGYDYYVRGIVVNGDKRGRQIGYPTANIQAKNEYKLIPPNGIYVVEIELVLHGKNQKFRGMASIGFRPTFYDDENLCIEVNIFDFDYEIYGSQVIVSFLHFIRKEEKFNTIEDLVKKIDGDKVKSLEYFNSLG